MKKITEYFSKTELLLWSVSVLLIFVSFIIFDRENYLILCASLIGATSLIFNAKGNPFGQVLIIIFSIIYGIISYSCSYYGEMITYVGMSAPMALWALISWLKNPYKGNKSEVKVNNHITAKEVAFMLILAFLVTVIFYYILKVLGTASLVFSTISITTSFLAVYLTARRSPYFAICYAANDIVLIILWVFATVKDIMYLSVIICFVVFLANDLYGFVNWKRMMKRQSKN